MILYRSLLNIKHSSPDYSGRNNKDGESGSSQRDDSDWSVCECCGQCWDLHSHASDERKSSGTPQEKQRKLETHGHQSTSIKLLYTHHNFQKVCSFY